MKAVRALVSGRVQGVFFRTTTRDRADGLGLDGWVRNLPNGRVEVVCQGPDDGVDRLVEWLHRGPPRARVHRVEVEEVPADRSLAGFEIRH